MAYIGIKALGGSTDGQTEETLKAENGKKDLLSPELVKIPWTIKNKYYSADVHFAIHPMRGLAPYLLQNIPAVIFVWRDDEVSNCTLGSQQGLFTVAELVYAWIIGIQASSWENLSRSERPRA